MSILCSCASDWLNIYYGVNCESRAVSLEAQLGITFGSLGVFSLDALSDHGEQTKKGNSDDDICSVIV